MSQAPDYLEQIFNSIADPVFVKDREHRWVYFNQAFLRLMGYPADQVLNKSDYEFFPKDQADVFWEKDEVVFNTGEENINEEAFTDATGKLHTIVTKKTRYTDKDGHSFIVGVIRDVTELKMLEKQLLESQKMESVGRLAGGIAHDFNNILMIISGYLEDLSERLTDTDINFDKEFREIKIATGRAADLIRQLLAFSRKRKTTPQKIDLNRLIIDMMPMIERSLSKSIASKVNLGRDLTPILIDRSQMSQIILNLSINAKDAMPNGGNFTIETRMLKISDSPIKNSQGEMAVKLVVRDTGVGIPDKDLPHIFEPFFSTKAQKGTGLGLATTYGIVQQANGHIDVESAVGRGTCFKLFFPALPEELILQEAETPDTAVNISGGAATILLAEDERPIRNLLEKVLTNMGFSVLAAENGGAAEALFQKYRKEIDLLITDVMMPEIGGFDLHRKLKEQKASIKTLFISGYADDLRDLIPENAAFLEKPFTKKQLTESIDELLKS